MKIVKTILRSAPMLILVASVSCQTVPRPPCRPPDYEQFTRPQAARMNGLAQTNLAPVYPFLAEFIVDKYRLGDKPGIGIDIGGGPGRLAIELAKRTPRYYWLNTDINPHHAAAFYQSAAATECAHRLGMAFADVHQLPFRDDYADTIVSRGSLQFWQDQKVAFGEILRVLKPGGHAFIGRGFSPNLPLETAGGVRTRQGGGMPKYDPEETAARLASLMEELRISDFEILRPRLDQREVSYGVWVLFVKPKRR